MKNAPLFLAGVLAISSVLSGCTDPPASVSKPAATKVTAKTDPIRPAVDALRQAMEPHHFRDALQLLKPLLESSDVQARLRLTAAQRDYLRQQVHLSDEELAEVEDGYFHPGDEYYLEECCLLRNAVQSLEVNVLSLPEQARLCFRWVTRNVLLHEQGDGELPNAFVLKRGCGSARARALVFLALMRQYQSSKQAQGVEGCLLVLPGPSPTLTLVGIYDGAKELYLFDPRLGEPILKDDRSVATLNDVKQNPSLLQASGIDSAQLRRLQAWLACPLPALAPRYKELERILSGHDRVKLYMEAAALQLELTTAFSLPVRVWNDPVDKTGGPNSPTRALRLFLPPEEGGNDRSVPPRMRAFYSSRLPWTAIGLGLEQLHLSQDLLPPEVHKILTQRMIPVLCKRYYMDPQDYLLHGRIDQMLARLDRIRPFLDDDSLASLATDRNFRSEVAAWRTKATAVTLAVVNNAPGAKVQETAFWNEDRYLLTLLSDAEDTEDQIRRLKEERSKRLKEEEAQRRVIIQARKMSAEEAKKFEEEEAKKAKEDTLTRILAFACREPLEHRSNWLVACTAQEKAERAQAVADADPKNSASALKARQHWQRARGAWSLYLGQIVMSPAALRQRLEPIHRVANPEQAMSLLEGLHLELHSYYFAKRCQAVAMARLEGGKAAGAFLQSVGQEIDGLLQAAAQREVKDSGVGWVSLTQEIDRLQQFSAKAAHPALRASLQRRCDLLTRDWGEQGAFAWLRRCFEYNRQLAK
jgi:hypothetical protein